MDVVDRGEFWREERRDWRGSVNVCVEAESIGRAVRGGDGS